MATAARPAVKSYADLFIGGRWVAPSSDRLIEVISPITEEVIATVPEAQPEDVDVRRRLVGARTLSLAQASAVRSSCASA